MVENYKVGQVLYVIPSDNAIVVPVQIMERRICETVSGTVVKHIIKSAKQKAPPMVLETIKGTVFSDLRQARDIMLRNATSAIDGMIKHAASVAQQAFAPKRPVVMKTEETEEFDPLGSADVFVDDSEMQPMVQEQNVPTMHMIPPPQQRLAPTNGHSLPPDVDADGMTEIMAPDGSMQRVRLKMGS